MPELEVSADVADVLPGGDEQSLPLESSEPEVSGEDVASPEEPVAPAEPKPEDQQEVQDGRVLSPEMRSHLKALKATNPKLEKQIRGMAFALNNLKENFPGGTKEAIGLKAQLQEFGGVDGIKELQQSAAGFKEIDAKIEKGDASVVDSLTEMLPGDAYPAFAQKLLGSFGAKDPEGYQRMMSGVIANTFEQAGISHHLARIQDYIQFGKPEEAIKMLQGLQEWSGKFGAIAATKPAPKTVDPQAQQVQTERQQLDQEKTKLFTESVSTEVSTWSKSRVQAEAAPFLKGRKLNDDQFEMLETKALNKVRKTLLENKQFTSGYQTYFNSKDKAGLLKFIKAETDKLLPAAVKDSYRLLFSDFSKPLTPRSSNGEQPPKPAASDPQFIKVSSPPDPNTVDLKRTPIEMRMRSKAVLKDGRRVTWG
jgi:hypothetical protein